MLQLIDPQGGGPKVARGNNGGLTLAPPASGGVVTPSDSVVYSRPIMVLVLDTGPVDVNVVPYGRDSDASVTYTLSAGMTVPVLCRQVLVTGTTAVSLFLGSVMRAKVAAAGGGGGSVTADSTTVTADTTTFTADNG